LLPTKFYSKVEISPPQSPSFEEAEIGLLRPGSSPADGIRLTTESVKRDQLFLAMLKDPKSSERLDVTEIPCVGEDDLLDGFEMGGDGGGDTEPEDAAAVADEATVA